MALNELQRIRNATHAYTYADERSKAFKDAKAYLNQVREKYGTIDPNVIADLIK